MTRGKWVALAVVVVVLAVLVPNGPVLWRAVAYVVEERIESAEPGVVHRKLSVPTRVPGFFVLGDNSLFPPNYVPPNYVVLKRKRFSWGPGPESLLLCGWCADEAHSRCSRRALYFAGPDELAGSRCSCLHPSHVQDSE